jgi:prepilin-type N-terminal cleavage/methylation domain-containing protein
MPSRVSVGTNSRFEIRNSKFSRAFTLIEIMVAIFVFSLVIAAVYSAWMALLKSTKLAEDVAAQAQRQRVTLRTIEDSLMAIQSFQASPQYYSFVVDNSDKPLLSFTARVPDVFPRNGKFINPNTGRDFNLRRLTFSVEPGENNEKNLVLRQNPVLMDLDDDELKYPIVLAENVQKFSVECWDPQKQDWADEWLDTNSLPAMLRVELVSGSTTTDAKAPMVALTRLLSMPSQPMPAAAQNGQGGGSGNSNQPRLQLPTPRPTR